MNLSLAIGNKAYSSWSLRPWLLLKYYGIAFEEVRIPLRAPDWAQRLAPYSAAGKVPALRHGDIRVWDSLAICEYVNEQFLADRAWPGTNSLRAHARSAVAEMHSGFGELRRELNMNLRREAKARAYGPGTAADIQRIQNLWAEALKLSEGPYLYGEFGIADAFFAPVVTRFRSYTVPLPAPLQDYADRILGLPALEQWYADARSETEVISDYELP